jgi:hypothetical protein
MRLSAPKTPTWWIAVIIGALGILFHLGVLTIAGLSGYAFWFVVIAFVLLTLATLFKSL